ncbi:hypothetical protein Tco_0963686 [Tanacetum coccineum]
MRKERTTNPSPCVEKGIYSALATLGRLRLVPSCCVIFDLESFLLTLYGTNALSKFSPDTELVLYPLQDKLTSRDKSLDLFAFKLSRLFFSLLSSGSSSCWRSYGA